MASIKSKAVATKLQCPMDTISMDDKSIHGGKRFECYYCHSYAAWEKGSCENLNRMIRRWFPKGTSFDEVSDEDVAMCQKWLREYPRKSLGWKCAGEISAA